MSREPSGTIPFSRSNVLVPYLAKLQMMCAFCYSERDNLRKCSSCERAAYCSSQCQKSHWKVHKKHCKELAKLNTSIREGSNFSTFDTRILEMGLLGKRLNSSSLMRDPEIATYVNHGKHCSICAITPIQGKQVWKNCPKCGHGWCCATHWNTYQPKHTALICSTYQQLNGVARFKLNHLLKYDEWFTYGPIDQNGNGLMNPSIPTTFFSNWEAYFKARCSYYDQLQPMHPYFFASATLGLTQVCTLLHGMQLFGWSRFMKPRLKIHVLGPDHTEISAMDKWEEMMHFCPNISHIEMCFVGPEFPTAHGGDFMENCATCKQTRKTRNYQFRAMTYHDFMDTEDWDRPDIVIAFNSGLHEECTASWKKTLKRVIAEKISAVFTSYNEEEAKKDNAVFERCGAKVVPGAGGVQNPFQDLDPHVEFSGKDEFYYSNYYITCFEGST